MRRKLRRATRYVSAAAGVATLAGMVLLGTVPAQAATAGPAQASAATAAAAPKSASAHYTNAPCNTSNLKKNYASCFAVVYTAIKNKIAASPDQPPAGALG